MAKKLVMAELRADVAGLRSDLSGAARMFEQLNSRIERMQTAQAAKGQRRGAQFNAGQDLKSRFSGAMQTAQAVAVGGAFYGLAGEMKQIRDYEKALVDLAVSGGEGREYLMQIRGEVSRVSDQYGIAKEDVLGFAQGVVTATGDTQLALTSMRAIGKVAYASGADIKDLANVMVQLQNVVKIPMSEAGTTFGGLIEQAQKGSFELKDMSAYLPGVISYMDQFGKSGNKSMLEFTALLQVAKRAVPDSAEAATATMRMFDQIQNKRGAIEKTLGIKLKDDRGQWKDMGEMMRLIATGIATNEGKMVKGKGGAKDIEGWAQSVFDVRGSKVMRQLVTQAKRGWDTKMGNYETYSALSQVSGVGAVEKMAASRKSLSGTDEWSKAMNEFRNHMHATLLPVVKKLAEWMPTLASAGKVAADNFGLLLAIMGSAKLLAFTRAWMMAATTAAATTRAATAAAATAGAAGASLASRLAVAGSLLLTTSMIAIALWQNRDPILKAMEGGPRAKGGTLKDLQGTPEQRTAAFDTALRQIKEGRISSDLGVAQSRLSGALARRDFIRKSSFNFLSNEGTLTAAQADVAGAARQTKEAFLAQQGGNRGFMEANLAPYALGMIMPDMARANEGSIGSQATISRVQELELGRKTAEGIEEMVGLLAGFIRKVDPGSKGKQGSPPR